MKKKYLAMLMTATIAMSTVLATVGCGADSSDAADPNASQESSTDEQSADTPAVKMTVSLLRFVLCGGAMMSDIRRHWM